MLAEAFANSKQFSILQIFSKSSLTFLDVQVKCQMNQRAHSSETENWKNVGHVIKTRHLLKNITLEGTHWVKDPGHKQEADVMCPESKLHITNVCITDALL